MGQGWREEGVEGLDGMGAIKSVGNETTFGVEGGRSCVLTSSSRDTFENETES